MYLDTKLLDNPKTRAQYVRGMLMTGLVVAIMIHFYEKGFSGSLSGGGVSSHYLPGLNEDILTGPPTF